MSQNFESDFVNIEAWNFFRKRFKSETTEASYWSDINEFCRICGKPFDRVRSDDVRAYYEEMRGRIEEGKISPLTLTKNFRELHSFPKYFLSREDSCLRERKTSFIHILKIWLKKRKPPDRFQWRRWTLFLGSGRRYHGIYDTYPDVSSGTYVDRDHRTEQ